MKDKRYVLAVDGGGTKTEGVLAAPDGATVARLIRGPSNYQAVGGEAALAVWSDLLAGLLDRAGAEVSDLAAAGFGLSGWDRPRDEENIRALVERLGLPCPMWVDNDTYLVLRAGTPDGVGVGLVSGTGANCAGENAAGHKHRVAGLGPEFGDLGGGTDIGVRGLQAAFRSIDGRGPATSLVDRIVERFHLGRLDDIVDYTLADSRASWSTTLITPLVFDAAADGDEQALGILEWAGQELGNAARAVARPLFAADEAFPVVMGGSVLQKGSVDRMRDVLIGEVHREFPAAVPVRLQARPVEGAVRAALALAEKES
ncbi:MAG: BadF/BadG/BcrA/BcrD ATPase family protein [Pseudomonadota bacterium]